MKPGRSLLLFASIALLFFAGSKPIASAVGLIPAKNECNENQKIDSFQFMLGNYERLKKTTNWLMQAIDERENMINENNKIILGKQKRQEDLSINKSKIMAKSLHKAKVNLTAEEKRNILLYDSLSALLEKDIANVKHKNAQASEYITQCKSKLVDNNKKLQQELVKIRNYTALLHHSKAFMYRGVNYLAFVCNLDSDEIRMHCYVPKSKEKNFHSLGAVKKYLEGNNLQPLMITNAGMFLPGFEPEGLYVEEHSGTFKTLDTSGFKPNANFYLKPNGVFYIDTANIPHIDTTEQLMPFTSNTKNRLKIATQSGPMLVINGNIHKAFMPDSENKKIRSGVGLISENKKKIVFLITLEESNFYDFATCFHDVFNCRNAMFLDGAISQMYLYDLAPEVLGGNFGPMISVSKK